MRRIFGATTAAVITAVCMPSIAQADSANKQFSLGAGLSLRQGAGIEASYQLTHNTLIRAAWYGGNTTDSERIGSIDFDLDLSFQHAGAFIDYRLFETAVPALRVTAGLLYNNDQLRGKGQPRNGIYKIAGFSVPQEQIGELNANAAYNRIQSYLGVGYDVQLSASWQVSADAGVLFQGAPSVHYSVSGPIQNAPDFASVLAQEEAKARDELEDYSRRPVLKLAAHYRF